MARAGAKRSTRKLKIARRLGVNLWGQAKSPFNKRKYKPGQHGPTSRGGNTSDYAKQMKAKQTLKGYYGNIGEKKFRAYYLEAANMKGDTPANLIGLLERRLDAVVYRAKLAPTVFSARQLVSHGHILVNGKRVKIASYQVKPGDEIRKMVTEIEEYCKDNNRTLAGFTEKKTKLEAMIDEYNAKQARQKGQGNLKKLEPLKPKLIESDKIKIENIPTSDLVKKMNSDTDNNLETPEFLEPLTPKLVENNKAKTENISTSDTVRKLNSGMEKNKIKTSEVPKMLDPLKSKPLEEKNVESEKITLSDMVEKKDANLLTQNQKIESSTKAIKETYANITNFEKSVWKDKNGNFNNTRLLSDSVAGFTMGAAGGLITSWIIKKNQEENGFEDINCTVGNQIVAGWNDEFRVGIK